LTNPLFASSLVDLKGRLRLEDLPPSSAANDILDHAILDARLTFYRRLGQTVVATLVALPYTTSPTTEVEVKRALAQSVEVKLVRAKLMRTLPHIWSDASGDAQRAWNDEAPYRERGMSDAERELKRLHDEIEEDFQILEGEDTPGEESDWRMYDGVRDTDAPRPGGSLSNLNPTVISPD